MSFWMATLSPDCAASASGLRRFCAVGDDETQTHRRAAIPADHRALMREILRRFGRKRKKADAEAGLSPLLPGNRLLQQLGERPGAVALLFLIDPVQLQHADEQIARRDRLALVREMAVSAQSQILAADQEVRHIVMLVLVGVAHVRAVHDDGVVEQRAVTLTNRLQLLSQIRRGRKVIAVQVRVAANLDRVVLVMRAAVEADAGAGTREELALRELIG